MARLQPVTVLNRPWLLHSVYTGAAPVKACRAPPKCSGCNSLDHNYRNCPNK
ncbi:hypothetical protein B0O99DRAFT_615211 [Bisporella sp. PMI_857]|nr:hypothetical protein B0O99DRAFT_615211 [Bisporella sp. PMI_857]